MGANLAEHIRQGYVSLEELTAEEQAEVSGIEPCMHYQTEIVLVLSECVECKRKFTHRIETEGQRFADTMQKILQGLLGKDVIELGDFTDEQKALLRQVEPCAHERREVGHCGDGNEKERCLDCGRRFASPSQWIRDHGSEVKTDGYKDG